jgi:asparagine synthetase B (glutamine-hydrolysing)
MSKKVDKNYCMSSFLTFRYVVDENKIFAPNIIHNNYNPTDVGEAYICDSAEEIDHAISEQLKKIDLSNAGLLLSGGMDSAILASYMPKGMKAYTAKCSAPGAIDETERAKRYCDVCGLEHVIVDITWDDYVNTIDELMLHDGSPLFANEPQVYKLVSRMKEDGLSTIILGDNADMAFGGMDRLLSRDWTYDEWKKRYTFVEASQVLKNPVDMDEVYSRYKVGKDGVDYIKFLNEIFAASSSGAYINAFKLGNMNWFDPYARLKMGKPLDLARVRSGDSKYLLRDLFRIKYPGLAVPEKIAMPRAVEQWMADWEGPTRQEFIAGCANGMTGEQKFMLYSLERFLNLLER